MSKIKPSNSILVTGATGDIGHAICNKLKNEGYYVIGLDIESDNEEHYDHFIKCDLDELVQDNECQKYLYNEISNLNKDYPLYALINNAAIQVIGSLQELDIRDVSNSLKVNVIAPFFLSKLTYQYLEKTKGCIVNIGSIHSNLTKPGFIAYATSKTALAGLTKSMSIELAGIGVRVNCIEPAAIETKMLIDGFKDNPEKLNKLSEFHPLNRIGKPNEVASLVNYLISEESSFITGSSFRIDGGIGNSLYDPL